jgi:hypothetical protein
MSRSERTIPKFCPICGSRKIEHKKADRKSVEKNRCVDCGNSTRVLLVEAAPPKPAPQPIDCPELYMLDGGTLSQLMHDLPAVIAKYGRGSTLILDAGANNVSVMIVPEIARKVR